MRNGEDFASPGQTPGTLSGDDQIKTWDGGGRQPKTRDETPEDGGVPGAPSSPPYAEGDITGEAEND
jgi:hypothetical protein